MTPTRILLIDDDEDQYVLTRSLLADIDGGRFTVEWQSDPVAALRVIGERRHDLCLLDYDLGERDGLEVLGEAIAGGSQVPFIMLTGHGDRDIDLAAMAAGAADYLTKDELDPRGLERAIRYALERARTLDELRRSEERYALAARGANDGLWDWDLDAGQMFYSERWCELLGCSPDAVEQLPAAWLERVHGEDLERLEAAIADHLAGRTDHLECEHRLLHADGSFRWILARGLAVRDREGRAYRMTGSSTDITERKVHDGLTGLPGKELFLDRVAGALGRARRGLCRPAVMMLDLDRFKLINDSLGHSAGDRLLIAVGARLREAVRPGDAVARLVGDEFAVLLDDVGDAAAALHTAARLIDAVAAPYELDGREVFPSASVGIALAETGYDEAETMLHDAAVAADRAKERSALGRGVHGGYELFDEDMRAFARARLQLENDLRRALERGQMRLEYQPMVSLATDRFVAAEALLRWDHPERGSVPPAEFVPVAEKIGLIAPLWEWVLEKSCREALDWRTPDGTSPALHVNLSPLQLVSPDVATAVERILEVTGFPPERLHLEITETSLVESAEAAERLSRELERLGVRLALDDFGKGYSSLGHLSRFHLHCLKIDKSFIDALGHSTKESEITRAIVALAHSLEMVAVAEGVESAEQWDRLGELGCDQVQGFFVARPQPGAELGRLLAGSVSGCRDAAEIR